MHKHTLGSIRCARKSEISEKGRSHKTAWSKHCSADMLISPVYMNTRDRVSFYDLSLTAIIALFICRTQYSHDDARNAEQMCAPAEAYLRKEDAS